MCAKLNHHVRLTIFLSIVVIMQNTQEKANLLKTKAESKRHKNNKGSCGRK